MVARGGGSLDVSCLGQSQTFKDRAQFVQIRELQKVKVKASETRTLTILVFRLVAKLRLGTHASKLCFESVRTAAPMIVPRRTRWFLPAAHAKQGFA